MQSSRPYDAEEGEIVVSPRALAGKRRIELLPGRESVPALKQQRVEQPTVSHQFSQRPALGSPPVQHSSLPTQRTILIRPEKLPAARKVVVGDHVPSQSLQPAPATAGNSHTGRPVAAVDRGAKPHQQRRRPDDPGSKSHAGRSRSPAPSSRKGARATADVRDVRSKRPQSPSSHACPGRRSKTEADCKSARRRTGDRQPSASQRQPAVGVDICSGTHSRSMDRKHDKSKDRAAKGKNTSSQASRMRGEDGCHTSRERPANAKAAVWDERSESLSASSAQQKRLDLARAAAPAAAATGQPVVDAVQPAAMAVDEDEEDALPPHLRGTPPPALQDATVSDADLPPHLVGQACPPQPGAAQPSVSGQLAEELAQPVLANCDGDSNASSDVDIDGEPEDDPDASMSKAFVSSWAGVCALRCLAVGLHMGLLQSPAQQPRCEPDRPLGLADDDGGRQQLGSVPVRHPQQPQQLQPKQATCGVIVQYVEQSPGQAQLGNCNGSRPPALQTPPGLETSPPTGSHSQDPGQHRELLKQRLDNGTPAQAATRVMGRSVSAPIVSSAAAAAVKQTALQGAPSAAAAAQQGSSENNGTIPGIGDEEALRAQQELEQATTPFMAARRRLFLMERLLACAHPQHSKQTADKRGSGISLLEPPSVDETLEMLLQDRSQEGQHSHDHNGRLAAQGNSGQGGQEAAAGARLGFRASEFREAFEERWQIIQRNAARFPADVPCQLYGHCTPRQMVESEAGCGDFADVCGVDEVSCSCIQQWRDAWIIPRADSQFVRSRNGAIAMLKQAQQHYAELACKRSQLKQIVLYGKDWKLLRPGLPPDSFRRLVRALVRELMRGIAADPIQTSCSLAELNSIWMARHGFRADPRLLSLRTPQELLQNVCPDLVRIEQDEQSGRNMLVPLHPDPFLPTPLPPPLPRAPAPSQAQEHQASQKLQQQLQHQPSGSSASLEQQANRQTRRQGLLTRVASDPLAGAQRAQHTQRSASIGQQAPAGTSGENRVVQPPSYSQLDPAYSACSPVQLQGFPEGQHQATHGQPQIVARQAAMYPTISYPKISYQQPIADVPVTPLLPTHSAAQHAQQLGLQPTGQPLAAAMQLPLSPQQGHSSGQWTQACSASQPNSHHLQAQLALPLTAAQQPSTYPQQAHPHQPQPWNVGQQQPAWHAARTSQAGVCTAGTTAASSMPQVQGSIQESGGRDWRGPTMAGAQQPWQAPSMPGNVAASPYQLQPAQMGHSAPPIGSWQQQLAVSPSAESQASLQAMLSSIDFSLLQAAVSQAVPPQASAQQPAVHLPMKAPAQAYMQPEAQSPQPQASMSASVPMLQQQSVKGLRQPMDPRLQRQPVGPRVQSAPVDPRMQSHLIHSSWPGQPPPHPGSTQAQASGVATSAQAAPLYALSPAATAAAGNVPSQP